MVKQGLANAFALFVSAACPSSCILLAFSAISAATVSPGAMLHPCESYSASIPLSFQQEVFPRFARREVSEEVVGRPVRPVAHGAGQEASVGHLPVAGRQVQRSLYSLLP